MKLLNSMSENSRSHETRTVTTMISAGVRESIAAGESPVHFNAIDKYNIGFVRICNALKECSVIDFEINEPSGGAGGGVNGGVSAELNSLLELLRFSTKSLKSAPRK